MTNEVFKPLKPSQLIKIAYANGCRTARDYAQYRKRKVIPQYMNDAILEQVNNSKIDYRGGKIPKNSKPH